MFFSIVNLLLSLFQLRMAQEGLSWILMIVALCILLLLYIIFTFFCLRRLCNRRGGMVRHLLNYLWHTLITNPSSRSFQNQAPEKQKKSDCDAEPGTPGVYSPARLLQLVTRLRSRPKMHFKHRLLNYTLSTRVKIMTIDALQI